MSFKYKRLDKNDAAVLLIDHQTGLFNLVRDFEPIQFKNNVLALADSAKFFNLPTILTTSFDNGPNGPLLPEIIERGTFSMKVNCRKEIKTHSKLKSLYSSI